ncbi:hypothetical protein DC083_01450 [Ignatzschineria ureiclastica]|uniref:Uncharacterized protein n=1 Tax=Ignatzschineria ureiclastica TaxID=472582 RepID=A0A2U2AGX1_9GAMM|nr:tetratricopeptide repeat protein [Ignatzschineria ureiclastica]PWD81877.1 hypothetical protein DC083_01450 [Ignatzschineria ureiclastica]GGZ91143.1 hypothetical protein GCM10007162_02760 [Ignatzschineria ureiclastica]
MNRYLLSRLRHSLFLVRNYLFALLMILTLIVTMTATRAAESHEALPIISKTFTAYQAGQQKTTETPSEHSSQEAPVEISLEIPPLTLQSQSITENGAADNSAINNDTPSDTAPNKNLPNHNLSQNQDKGGNQPDVAQSPIVLYSPLVFSYWEQLQEAQVATPKLTAQEIVNNEFLHDTITDLISQHETPINETIELLSAPLQTTASTNTVESTPVTSEIAVTDTAITDTTITDTPIELLSTATPIATTSNDSENNENGNQMTSVNVTTTFNSPYLTLISRTTEKNDVAELSTQAIIPQETIPAEEPQVESSYLPLHQDDLTDKEIANVSTHVEVIKPLDQPETSSESLLTDIAQQEEADPIESDIAEITEIAAVTEITQNDENPSQEDFVKDPFVKDNQADDNPLVEAIEPELSDETIVTTEVDLDVDIDVDADTNINSNVDNVTDHTEEPINNYLLYALFPHHKKSVIEAPLSKSYKENHEANDNHESDLSIMKLADKIDHSLSFNEEMNEEEMEGTIDEDAGLEAELAEGYFDSYQDYQQHYKTLDEDEVLSLESQAYPYVQDPQLEEALSSAEFEDLSINQQIEQLLTTGDYYILADDVVKGRQYYIQAVRIGAKDKNSPIYAKALVKLADLEENPYLARFQYTNALDIYETHVGFDMEIADILVKLVWTFDVTTERIVIYELLTSAKQILEKYSYSPQYTMVLRNLAIYYEAVNDFENADAHYQAALALDLEHLTTNDIRTILALENYAAFYLKFREYQKAEEILLFKLKAHEEAETPDYYNLGRTQSMLGWTYLQQKNLDDALHYYNAALGNINYSITKNRFMPHYYSLPAIFDLIYFFNVTEDPDRGVPYFEVAQALLEGENEAAILDYLKETPKEMIDLGRIVNYPWAATAEVEGLITMMHYIDEQ